MIPTSKVGDFIVGNKWTYGHRLPVLRNKFLDVGNPERGDVVVFFPPHESRYFIKRLVGLPGDKISIINGTLFVNNEMIEQTISDIEPGNSRSPQRPYDRPYWSSVKMRFQHLSFWRLPTFSRALILQHLRQP